jgi:sugar phosphate isomerase/epimerase
VKLGVCAQALYDLPFDQAVETAIELGFETIELAVDHSSPFVEGDLGLRRWERIVDQLRRHRLEISALSTHQESQLLLGPHGIDTDGILAGSAKEKSDFARRRLTKTAELAARIDVGVVIGFTGCEDYSRWFPWPLADGYERMGPAFREALLPVLDAFAEVGVVFALECHPRQFAYNLETALYALELVEHHDALAFNFDPANLLLAGMRPEAFIVELGDRIRHVHAKDGELLGDGGRSGLLAHGSWDRPGRGFRFRVPGWGDLDWRSLISALQVAGYRGTLAVEHEDPTMSRREGLRQAVSHLAPIVLREPPADRFW